MMHENKVSLIVPIYRHPEWVKAAVDSALSQSYRNLEILLVDDGSPDGCGALCDEYAAADPRVRVLHQENGGVSAARNTGLKYATGEYIAFLDSDDRLESNHIEGLVNLLEGEEADLASCGMIFYRNEREQKPFSDAESVTCFSTEEAVVSMHREGEFNGYVMPKLYRRGLLEGIRFDPSIAIHEDMLFLWQVILRNPKIVYSQRHSYHYLIHHESAMNSTFSPKYETAIDAACQMVALMEENFPQNGALARKTLLFALLSVANKRAAANVLDQASYLRLRILLDRSHSSESASLIVGLDNRISYRMLRKSRKLFLFWKWLLRHIRKKRN